MGSFSLTHWLVVLAIILILFGAGKLPRVMGDFAKGIKNFKAGMKDDDDRRRPRPRSRTPASRPTARLSTRAAVGWPTLMPARSRSRCNHASVRTRKGRRSAY